MKKVTFQQKLWIPLICSLLCITVIFVYNALEIRKIRIEERSADLSNAADLGLGAVKMFGDLAASGALTQEEAQKQAIAVIKSMRFGETGYLSIINLDAVVVMNPAAPQTNGKNMADFKDANGTYLYRDIVAVGKSDAGKGFVHYYFPRPGQKNAEPKMSRVVAYKPWSWTIVVGVYMDDIDAAFRQSLITSLGVLLLVCGLLAAVVVAINRSLRHALGGDPEYAADVAAQIANNDLSGAVRTHANDRHSVLYAMKTMQANLVDAISEIRHSAETIATASSEIASGNMDLSARTEMQASSLEETAASMEELTSTVTQNAGNAVQANELAQSASAVARQGGAVVAQVIGTMDTINASSRKIVVIIGVIDGIAFQTNILALTSTVKQNADNAREANKLAATASDVAIKGGSVVSQVVDTMSSINESAKKIVDIIGVIDGIAFQTNILALNAAVEAARAGEQGRGFAVVASEVRNLAQRSAGAAKEIKILIDDSAEKTERGTRLVGQAGVTMGEVVDSVRRVTDIMSEIASASQEQSAGIEQVNLSIIEMDGMTQQNAALVEQAAAAAQSLQDQAAELAHVVSIFKLVEGEEKPAAYVPAPAAAAPVAVRKPAPALRPVKSLTRKTEASAPAAAPAPRKAAGAGSNDEWEEF